MYNRELNIINVYPNVKFQQWLGFGGAVTSAVGKVLSQLTPEKSQQIIEEYFGTQGINYNIIRTHIDSCDFAEGQYWASDDAELNDFSIRHDIENIIPWIHKACKAAKKNIPVMLSPWSPPAYMKTNNSRIGGGHLKKEYYEVWAKYVCRYIEEYKNQGINVEAVSVQNEPNAVQRWDSCIFTPNEEKTFISDYLYKELNKNKLDNVKIYMWDHNKERLFDRATEIIDESTTDMIYGAAFHWYSGDHFEALRLFKKYFPDKKLLFTEGCIEYSKYSRDQLNNAAIYAHDIIGNINAGMDGFIDWNICLNNQGGPNYVGNYCQSPIVCNLQENKIEHQLSFYYLKCFSKNIQVGASRIGTTSYTDKIEVTAFKNLDESIVVIMFNNYKEELPYCLRYDGKILSGTLQGRTLSAFII